MFRHIFHGDKLKNRFGENLAPGFLTAFFQRDAAGYPVAIPANNN